MIMVRAEGTRMPVNRKAAACLTISTGLGLTLVIRGWPFFEWGHRGFRDFFYIGVVIITLTAFLGVVMALVPRRRERSANV